MIGYNRKMVCGVVSYMYVHLYIYLVRYLVSHSYTLCSSHGNSRLTSGVSGTLGSSEWGGPSRPTTAQSAGRRGGRSPHSRHSSGEVSTANERIFRGQYLLVYSLNN